MDHHQLLEALVDDKLAMAVLHDQRHWVLLPDCDAACGYGASDAPKLLALCKGVLLTLALTPATDEEPEKISVQVDHRRRGVERRSSRTARSLRRSRSTLDGASARAFASARVTFWAPAASYGYEIEGVARRRSR
jgi:hypothetical protein